MGRGIVIEIMRTLLRQHILPTKTYKQPQTHTDTYLRICWIEGKERRKKYALPFLDNYKILLELPLSKSHKKEKMRRRRK